MIYKEILIFCLLFFVNCLICSARAEETSLRTYNQKQVVFRDDHMYTKAGDLLTGRLKEYNSKGELIQESFFKDGLLDGVKTVFDAYSTQILKTTEYKNGLKNGKEEEFFDDDGQRIKSRAFYKEGARDGDYEIFVKDGSLALKTFYVNGKIHGDLKEFSDGHLIHIAHFENGVHQGEDSFYMYDYAGTKKRYKVIPYVDGLVEGTVVTPFIKAQYKAGKKDGKTIVLSEVGYPLMEIIYKNDEAVSGVTYCEANKYDSSDREIKVNWRESNIRNYNNDCPSALRCSYDSKGDLIKQ